MRLWDRPRCPCHWLRTPKRNHLLENQLRDGEDLMREVRGVNRTAQAERDRKMAACTHEVHP